MAKKFSEEELGEFQEIFEYFDTNEDGIISKRELLVGLTVLTNSWAGSDSLEAYDIDGDGKIDQHEFGKFMSRVEGLEKFTPEEIFGVFDRNDDGFIEIDDLSNILRTAGDMNFGSQLSEAFQDVSEGMNFEEFLEKCGTIEMVH